MLRVHQVARPLASLRPIGLPRVFSRSFLNFPSFNQQPQTHTLRKKINVTPQQLFRVVADVHKYKEFVPFCEDSSVNARDPETNLPTEAALRVGWQQFDERFTCKLECEDGKRVLAESITISLFHSLKCEWTFHEVKTFNVSNQPSCEVKLELSYHFKNPLYNTISSMFSEQVSAIMIEAFEERAMQLKLRDRNLR